MNYYLAINEEAKGPYTLEQLRSMWNAGSITGDMFFCQEGDAEWHPLSDILQQLQSTPAPATPPPSPPLQPPPMTEKVKESAPKKKKSFFAKVGYVLLILIAAPILLAIILPMCSKTSTQTTDFPPRPVANNTQSGGSNSTTAKVAPKASAVQPAVAATSTPAPEQEPFPKEGSWPNQVHLLKNTQLSGAVGSIGYNAGTEVFAFLSDDHKTVTVQVEQLKATIPIEDTDFLALARINQGKKEEAAKHEQERAKAELEAKQASDAAAVAAEEAAYGAKPVCYDAGGFGGIGIPKNVETIVKRSMKNPDSFKIRELYATEKVELKGVKCWRIAFDYQAQNGFGGNTVGTIRAWIKNGQILDIQNSEDR